MILDDELVSDFAKITNDETSESKDTVVYGTITIVNNVAYVQVDGADDNTLTPITSTVEVSEGDRVLILLKNHQAIVQSNLTDQSAGVSGIESKLEGDNLILNINAASGSTTINGDKLNVNGSTLDISENESITIKVGTDEVISCINNSEETSGGTALKINANKIDIAGKVTFSSLDSETQNKITTAQTTADNALKASDVGASGSTIIDGGRILSGVIDADRIDTDAIFAGNICATGTMNLSNDHCTLCSGLDTATMDGSNIRKYFSVVNEQYFFKYDSSSSAFIATNLGVNDTYAQTTLKCVFAGKVQFTYQYVTETNCDMLYIYHNSTTKVSGVSGSGSASLTLTVSRGDTIRFLYTKDSSTSTSGETCKFYDMVCTPNSLYNYVSLLSWDRDLELDACDNNSIFMHSGHLLCLDGSYGTYVLPGTGGDSIDLGTFGTYYRILTTNDNCYKTSIETGSWTPKLNYENSSGALTSLSTTYTSRYGWYTKVGNYVYGGFYILTKKVSTSATAYALVIDGFDDYYTPDLPTGFGGVAYGIYTDANYTFQGWYMDINGYIRPRVQYLNSSSSGIIGITAGRCPPSGTAQYMYSGTFSFAVT